MPEAAAAAADIAQTDFDRIRRFIASHCGIVVGDEKSYLIESRLARLVAETGCEDFTQFCEVLEGYSVPGLRDKVIDAITTNETLWFRDKAPFEMLRNDWLPQLASRSRNGQPIRIWSAGCSTGQEPYSVAMVIDRFAQERPELDLRLSHFEIMATDISPTVLYVAANGRYDALATRRGMEDYYLERYFNKQGQIWVLDDRIRRAVTFGRMNLQDSFAAIGRYDLVLCRNVLIYFSDLFKTTLFDKFARVLNPEGIMLLGSAETTLGITERFQRIASDDSVYYKVKEDMR